jgi:septal ring factor EnvC (AmiA/AmiB activator)
LDSIIYCLANRYETSNSKLVRTAIAAWFNGIRQRRNLRKFVNDLSEKNKEFKDKTEEGDNKGKYIKKLESLQTEIKNALTRWKISEHSMIYL